MVHTKQAEAAALDANTLTCNSYFQDGGLRRNGRMFLSVLGNKQVY